MQSSAFVVVLLLAAIPALLPSTPMDVGVQSPVHPISEPHFHDAAATSEFLASDGILADARPGFPGRDPSRFLESFGGYFTENRGQVAAPVRYYSSSAAIAFRDDGVMLVLRERAAGGVAGDGRDGSGKPEGRPLVSSAGSGGPRLQAVLLQFDSPPHASPVGHELLSFRSNYLIGDDPYRWSTDVPNYREIVYGDLYPGIDAVFRASPNGVKYEFRVRPGANPGAIRLTYDGVQSVRVIDGGVVASTPLGDIREAAPYSYQGTGESVDCRFATRGPRSYGFECPGRDGSRVLTIDPLVYSTFLGGSDGICGSGDRGTSIDVDEAGNTYILGGTCSTDFPATPGAFDTSMEFTDPGNAFVAKLNPAGSALVYATFLGGNTSDYPGAIAVDAAGDAFITGTTFSLDFPTTPGTFNPTFYKFGGSFYFSEAFVTELNPSGNGLVYSTFLGGDRYEVAWGIAVDSAGDAYVTGETNSSTFPTTPFAFDRTFNSYYGPSMDFPDVFLTKLSPDGSVLVYSTFIGGRGWEWPYSLAIDAAGNAYLSGDTNSSRFPTTAGAYDATLGPPYDAFVLKVDAVGRFLVYSTFLGGDSWENAFGIAVDSSGSAYVTGDTNSTDFPVTPGAFQRTPRGGRDAFVTKFGPTGATLAYSTLLGGSSPIDCGRSIAVGALGDVFVTGYTDSADFPVTPDAFDTVHSNREAFVTQLDATGGGLLYSTFLGGSGSDEEASSIAVDGFGIAYVAGWTNSTDFPTTPDAFDRTLAGLEDAFIVKLLPVTAVDRPDLAIAPVDIAFDPAPARVGTPVAITATVHNLGGTNATNVLVRFHDGPPSPSNQIGVGQVIPLVERFFGSGLASVVWPAGPAGTHPIWVVVDPGDAIAEKREDNNRASASIDVLPLEPNLEVSPSDLSLQPAPPYTSGTPVRITVTVHNTGGAPSGPTAVRFYDLLANPPNVGTDQPVPSLPAGGTATASVPWTAAPSGVHTLCVLVDPLDLVAEMEEGDNTACVQARVLTPPDLEPTAIAFTPAPPLAYGSTARGDVTVSNLGGEAAGSFEVLLFDDTNGNRLPDAGEDLGRSSVAGLAGNRQTVASIRWDVSRAGNRIVCAVADPPPGTVTESNEGNNVRCVVVSVRAPPPITSLVIGNPNVTAPQTYVTSSTELAFSVLDRSGSGVRRTVYRIDGGAWADYAATGLFTISGDGEHDIEWYSEDNAGDVESLATQAVRVDDTPPVTTPSVGEPKFVQRGTFVAPSTPIALGASDRGITPVGLARTEYRIDGGAWILYVGPFSLEGGGAHAIEYISTDLLGNAEPVGILDAILDDTPPAITVEVGEPRYEGANLYVASATPVGLAGEDTGAGIAALEFRIDGGPWSPYVTRVSLTGPDGPHTIGYRGEDRVGNAASGAVTVVLDNTAPRSRISPDSGPARPDTRFTVTAEDAGSGVARTEYGVDGDAWRPYTGPFALAPGPHVVRYRSVDNVDNAEVEETVSVAVESPPGEPNWKPVVAATFSTALALAGAWSAKRGSRHGGPARSREAKAFLSTSLPFVVAEAVTGVVSLGTGLLAIPPLLGPGAAVDGAILVAGVAVAVQRARRESGRGARDT